MAAKAPRFTRGALPQFGSRRQRPPVPVPEEEIGPVGFGEVPEDDDSPEVPDLTPDPVSEDEPALDVRPIPLAEMERPPSMTGFWADYQGTKQKVDILWQARENLRVSQGGKTLWHCESPILDKDGHPSGVMCDFSMYSTPPATPKDPPLVCPIHGRATTWRVA